ncbi:Nitrate-induced NOI protein [Zea mays]|uniref:Nitrate-induced NOI protein n=1 Tax=Zea mays TaxID=4577 RepID=A0A1D6DYZ0_MAIZE|nr:Nitrate-induced NOI protein [Zea mays]
MATPLHLHFVLELGRCTPMPSRCLGL